MNDCGHFEDNGYGGTTFVPYHESDDEAYERLQATEDEAAILREEDEHLALFGECERCGEKPAMHTVWGRDVTPTDRGDWIQEYDMQLCDHCAEKGVRQL